MMTQPNQSDVISGMLCLHHLITRAIDVTEEKSKSLANGGFSNGATMGGFANYTQTLASVLRLHHNTEDQLAFPYFREKLPGAPYELLEQEHHQLDPLLPEIEAASKNMGAEETPVAALMKIHQTVCRLKELWHPHIRKEEEFFTHEALMRLVEPGEDKRFAQVLLEHAQKHAQPDYLVVPFLLHNLPKEEREHFARTMPPIVTEQLVPVVWKEKWASMSPFLVA